MLGLGPESAKAPLPMLRNEKLMAPAAVGALNEMDAVTVPPGATCDLLVGDDALTDTIAEQDFTMPQEMIDSLHLPVANTPDRPTVPDDEIFPRPGGTTIENEVRAKPLVARLVTAKLTVVVAPGAAEAPTTPLTLVTTVTGCLTAALDGVIAANDETTTAAANRAPTR